MGATEDLRAAAKDRPLALAKAKAEEGAKVVEFIGNFISEEMIYAAGAKPYLLCRGGEPDPPDAVVDELLRYMNPLARSIAGNKRLGLDPCDGFTDMIAASQHECHVQRLADWLEFREIPVQKVGVTCDWERPFAAEYYYKQLVELKQKLEELTGNQITDEKLAYYIGQFNQINALLRAIGELRKADNPPLGASEFIRLNHDSFFVEPEFAVEKLQAIYDELKKAPGKFSEDAPRILIVGHGVAVGDYIVVNRLEELGAVVATEFLEEGIRWYQWDTATDGDDLVRNIFNAKYTNKVPVNIMQPSWRIRFDYLKQLIEDYRIDGVVFYELLYDEEWDLEYTCIAKWLGEMGIPLTRIDTSYEYTREAMAPLNTRLESFIDVLKSKKGGK